MVLKVANRTGHEFSLMAVLALGLLQGCVTVGPDYTPPEPEMPDAWVQAATEGLTEGKASLQTWWTTLNDPVLDSFILRASAGNLDLQEAVARIREARARLGIPLGEQFPDINGQGLLDRARISEGIFDPPPPPQDRTDTFYSLGLDASWEIDFWGRIKRSIESADASLGASVEDYRDVLVLLYADVALTYVDVRTLQARIRFARANAEAQRGTLQLTKDRFDAGIAPELDIRQAEFNLAGTESLIPTLQSRLVQAINRLGVLLGERPNAVHAELAEPAPIPVPPDDVTFGLPADLLRQRPDIRRAERALAAQNAQIGVATADLYPRFSLVGTFSLDAVDTVNYWDNGNIAYGFGPTFRWNLFDGGRIRSNIQAQDALTEQALVRYENTVLRGLEDVESSMVTYVRERDRREILARGVAAAQRAVEIVRDAYIIGLIDFQNVLDTERTSFEQQDQLAESEGDVTKNLIRIYKALGGGWAP